VFVIIVASHKRITELRKDVEGPAQDFSLLIITTLNAQHPLLSLCLSSSNTRLFPQPAGKDTFPADSYMASFALSE